MSGVVVCHGSAQVRERLAAAAAAVPSLTPVRTAASGVELVRLARVSPPNIVLLDAHLPSPGPIETLRQLRLVARSTVVVVLATAGDEVALDRAITMGARGYLAPDAAPAELAAVAAHILAAPVLPGRTPDHNHDRRRAGVVLPSPPQSSGSARTAPGGVPAPGAGRRTETWPAAGAPGARSATTSAAPPSRGPEMHRSGAYGPVPRGVSDGSAIELTKREYEVLTGMSNGRSNIQIGADLFLSEDTIKTHAQRLFRKLGAKDRAQAVAIGIRRGYIP